MKKKDLPIHIKANRNAMVAAVNAVTLAQAREHEQRREIATALIGEAIVSALRQRPGLFYRIEPLLCPTGISEKRQRMLKKKLGIEELTAASLVEIHGIALPPRETQQTAVNAGRQSGETPRQSG